MSSCEIAADWFHRIEMSSQEIQDGSFSQSCNSNQNLHQILSFIYKNASLDIDQI